MRTRRKGHGERRQPCLWLTCAECGRALQPAGTGAYVACPAGHGGLQVDYAAVPVEPEGEPCGSLFDTDD